MTASSMHRLTTRARGRVARLIGLPAAAAVALGASLIGAAPADAAPGPRAAIVTPVADPATDLWTMGSPADATIVMPWDGLDPTITVWVNRPAEEGESITAALAVDDGEALTPIAGPAERAPRRRPWPG